jgi:predicted lipoprotein with Yx(FWY)xxD motif
MRHRLAAAPLLVALFVAACTGGAASPAPTVGPASAPASVAPSVASTAPSAAPSASSAGASSSDDGYGGGYTKGGGSSQAAGSGGLALATTGLGKVLVGPTGNTLYMFAPDTTSTSACTGGCASNWPPLTGAMPSLGTGLDAEDFATITRADGSAQITFYGHPLYYFANDKAAGDTNGQGLNGKWYVLGADGNPIK